MKWRQRGCERRSGKAFAVEEVAVGTVRPAVTDRHWFRNLRAADYDSVAIDGGLRRLEVTVHACNFDTPQGWPTNLKSRADVIEPDSQRVALACELVEKRTGVFDVLAIDDCACDEGKAVAHVEFV